MYPWLYVSNSEEFKKLMVDIKQTQKGPDYVKQRLQEAVQFFSNHPSSQRYSKTDKLLIGASMVLDSFTKHLDIRDLSVFYEKPVETNYSIEYVERFAVMLVETMKSLGFDAQDFSGFTERFLEFKVQVWQNYYKPQGVEPQHLDFVISDKYWEPIMGIVESKWQEHLNPTNTSTPAPDPVTPSSITASFN
ncbi:MAG: hypothetical protein ACHP9Y_02440 [Gammaproteobacteria bacterium]